MSLIATPLAAQRGTPQAPGYHIVSVPTAAGAGEARETKVVLETPHVKLATVILRKGTVLEEHSSPMAVTVHVISGRGTIEMGDSKEIVGPGSVLALSPDKKHLVRPDTGADMILLVHHLKSPGRGQRRPGTP
jgi:quercetin dioxygenase-like cupin family protein